MPIRINGNQYLVPAPLVSMSKEYITSTDGQVIGNNFNFTLQGTLLPNKGNPISSGTPVVSSFSSDGWTTTADSHDDPYHTLTGEQLVISMTAKQEQIRKAFAGNAVQVEILGYNSNQGIKFYGDVVSMEFSEAGRWVLPCQYTVVLKTTNFTESVGSGVFGNHSNEAAHTYYVQSAGEDWSLEEGEPIASTGNVTVVARTFVVSHNINAVGQRVYGSGGAFLNGLSPWQQASGYVHSVIGAGFASFPSGLLNPVGNFGYSTSNRTFSEQIDRRGGSYSMTESFLVYPSGLLPSGTKAVESVEFNVDRGDNGITTVSAQGTIAGMYTLNPTSVSSSGTDKYANAVAYFNSIEPHIYQRARNSSGLSWLNPIVRSKGTARSPIAGTISYNYSYDTSPPNLIPSSISESIQVTDTYPGQIFATIPVIGRSAPILQYVNSRTGYQRSIQININFGPITQNWTDGDINSSGVWGNFPVSGVRSWFTSQKPSIKYLPEFSGIYSALNPALEPNVVPSKVFYSAPTETWDPKNGAYSFSTSWSYETSG